MQALIYIFLQCIIHKAMARNAGFASEHDALNANTEMRPRAAVIGSYVACMRRTFVSNFNKKRG
jgi:hypothetical protein